MSKNGLNEERKKRIRCRQEFLRRKLNILREERQKLLTAKERQGYVEDPKFEKRLDEITEEIAFYEDPDFLSGQPILAGSNQSTIQMKIDPKLLGKMSGICYQHDGLWWKDLNYEEIPLDPADPAGRRRRSTGTFN